MHWPGFNCSESALKTVSATPSQVASAACVLRTRIWPVITAVMSVAEGVPQLGAGSVKVAVTVVVLLTPALTPPGANTRTSSFCVAPAGRLASGPFTGVSPASIWPSPLTSR
ncbi:hypothetical protein D9M72_325160 [compost metagenome]